MKKLFTLLLSLVIFSSCEKDNEIPVTNDHIVFMYMGMDNSLSSHGLANIESIKKGLEAGKIRNGKVIAFCDFRNQTNSYLKEYAIGRSGKCVETVLIDYKEDLDSSDPNVFAKVVADVQKLTNAKEYSLIVSSHGLGWAPVDVIKSASMRYNSSMPSRDVIEDNGTYMNIEDLAKAIPSNFFTTILFDACFMGNIETLYALRNKSKYIVASISETYVEGLPYSQITSQLFDMKSTTEQRMDAVCKTYHQYYSTITYAAGGNIALYDCSKINNVKNVMVDVINRITPKYWSEAGAIQYYDRYDVKMFYDMEHAVRSVIPISDPLYMQFSVALKSMVICAYSTPTVYYIYINNFCGVAMYVPYKSAKPNAAYTNTLWYKDVYGNNQLP